LRKDFVIDERQIAEAIEWGADAVLLIVAILDDAKLARFYELASGAGLSVLVEVHDAAELRRAQAINAPLIGVNNRDLKDFTVDLGATESLAAQMDFQQTLLVAESGIDSRTDVKRLTACGARAILVGESLLREDDIGAKVRSLGGRS
jgi:indole-3-glycerol phosphate synthase